MLYKSFFIKFSYFFPHLKVSSDNRSVTLSSLSK
uniref:Uncharacterized protein n=1 Tax=Anguilla anguilla TaxID=7936 RepID=A0A0E9PDZ9_ANGAN